MSQKFNILGNSGIVTGKVGFAALNRAAKIEKQTRRKDDGKSISRSNQNEDIWPQGNKICP